MLKLKLKNSKIFQKIILAGLGFLLTSFLSLLAFNLFYRDKIFPGITIANINVAGKTINQVESLLKEKVVTPEKIILFVDSQEFEMSLKEIDFANNFSQSVLSAYRLYRSGNFFSDITNRLFSFYQKKGLALVIEFNQEKLDEYLSVISGQVSEEPVYPYVSFENGKILVNKGKVGKTVDLAKLKNEIIINLSQADYSPIFVPFSSLDPTLSEEQALGLKTRAENLLGKSLTLTHEYNQFVFWEEEIFELLDSEGKYQEENILKLIDNVSKLTNRGPQNALFKFEGGKVVEFLPAKEGVVINQEELKSKIIEQLALLENTDKTSASIEIPVQTSSPAITTEQVNSLGIKELIGRGTSKFAGSISSRIHNIGVASAKLNGVLVAPDEVFSFNHTLGDVSELTGYKQAYIIKDGKTVLGDGGGVCQVSTTFFRTILDAGLPILERQAHAYRVAYYEQGSPPGFDATVYDPTTDLKFKNDTPGHLLIQTFFNPKTTSLVFEIYGTSDNRVATTTKPVVTDVVPPPEDLYIDDPNLPQGTVEQIDWKAWGAKVWFDYSVKRNNEVIYQKRFYSNYQPWQAKFLRGTGPIQ